MEFRAYRFVGFDASFSAILTWAAHSLRPGTAFFVQRPLGRTFRHFAIVLISFLTRLLTTWLRHCHADVFFSFVFAPHRSIVGLFRTEACRPEASDVKNRRSLGHRFNVVTILTQSAHPGFPQLSAKQVGW